MEIQAVEKNKNDNAAEEFELHQAADKLLKTEKQTAAVEDHITPVKEIWSNFAGDNLGECHSEDELKKKWIRTKTSSGQELEEFQAVKKDIASDVIHGQNETTAVVDDQLEAEKTKPSTEEPDESRLLLNPIKQEIMDKYELCKLNHLALSIVKLLNCKIGHIFQCWFQPRDFFSILVFKQYLTCSLCSQCLIIAL